MGNRENNLYKKIDNYVVKLEKTSDYILHTIEKFEIKLSKSISWIYYISKKVIDKLYSIYNLIANKHFKFIIWSKKTVLQHYKTARYTTIPFNKIWLYFWKKWRLNGATLLHAKGMHFFVALQGGGKSSLIYDLIEEDRIKYSKGAYINVELENPRLDDDSKLLYVYHKQFQLEDFWGLTKKEDSEDLEISQKKQFNTEYFNNVVFDEWLANMNHRQNMTKAYKNVFIALISSLARMRHQGIRRILIASQLDTTDTQMMHMFKYIHQIEVVLDIEYWKWIEDGLFEDHIIGWQIWTYSQKRNRKKGSTELTFVKKHYRKRTADFKYYNSLNQAKEYNRLPVDKLEKGVIK